MTDSAQDYQKLLTETLQKQIIIFGPAITLAKARQVSGLTVADDGRVTAISAPPQEVMIQLLERFRELSPLLAKKTMQPILNAVISPVQQDPHAPTDKKAEEAPSEEHPAEEKKTEDKK